MVSVCNNLNKLMEFYKLAFFLLCIDALLEGWAELIRFGLTLTLFAMSSSYIDYKSAISTHYLPNQWFNFNQTCIDILLGEDYKLIRFWCTLPYFQGHIRTLKCQILTKIVFYDIS